MHTVIAALAGLLFLFGAGSAAAGQSIEADGVWSRALPAVSRTGAVYLTLSNHGATADRLLGASTAAASRAELHTHSMEGGMMRMYEVPEVLLAPGQSVAFKPHGLHIMLFDLTEPLNAGRRFMLTLRFAQAEPLQVEVEVLASPPARSGMR